MASQIEFLRLALLHSPENVPLLLLYAKACADEFQLTDVRTAYLSVVRLDVHCAEAKLGLAQVAMLEGKTSEAIVLAEQLAEEQPNCASAFVFLSRLVAGEGDLTRARTLFERAKKFGPKPVG